MKEFWQQPKHKQPMTIADSLHSVQFYQQTRKCPAYNTFFEITSNMNDMILTADVSFGQQHEQTHQDNNNKKNIIIVNE